MAYDLETIPTGTADDEEERRRRAAAADPLETLRRNAAAITPTPNAPISPEDYDTEGFTISHLAPETVKSLGEHDANSDLGRATRKENLGNFAMDARPQPLGVRPMDTSGAPELSAPTSANNGLQSLSATPSLKPITSFADRQALPTISPGAPAGSAASTEARLARMQDQDKNPWGSAENHPGFGGKLAHVLARVGNIAGDIVAPGTMELIPGTQLNREAKERNLQNLEGQQATREETVRKNKATEESENEDRELTARKLDILENKPVKPDSVDQQAVDSKMNEVNPATGKNFTAYEARVELSNDIAAGKAKPAGPPKTVTMLDKEGGKPFLYEYDRDKEYSGDEGLGHWHKMGPAQPNALALGLVGSITPLIDPTTGQIVGTMNSKTAEFKPLNPAQAAVVGPGGTGGTSASGARVQNTRTNQFNTQYVNPANQIETNYQKAQAAMDAYNANPQTGAAGMIMLSQHIATTLGGVKGVSTGETMIHEHENALGLEQRAARFMDYLKTGQPLSSDQMNEFNHIIKETRDITWNVAAKEAARRKQKVDFLPDDVPVNLKDSSGKSRPVPGNRVQEYLDKGAKF